MAVEYNLFSEPGLVAGSDFSVNAYGYQGTAQFLFAKVTADFTVDLCSATTDAPEGVIQNNPVSGDGVQLMRLGWSKVVAGADLTAGQLVGTNAHGQAIPLTTAGSHGTYAMGTVIGGCSSGEVATISLKDPFFIA